MTFKIVVCIKQVPDTNDIKWTEHNTIQREGLDSVINPYDIGAIQLAKNFKYLIPDSEITVVTMGPNQAIDALKTAVAMGCDDAVLLSDKRFSGSDTLATAYCLSQYIKTFVPDFDLIICGQQAVDGDTAQTPSSMAQKLNIEQITNVIAIKEANNDFAVCIKDTNDYKQEIKASYPFLMAVSQRDVDIIPDINGYIKAQNKTITVLNADDIKADTDSIGIKGSPTQVRKAFRPLNNRKTIRIENESVQNIADFIVNEVNKCRTADE